jgi:hypothetical protein
MCVCVCMCVTFSGFIWFDFIIIDVSIASRGNNTQYNSKIYILIIMLYICYIPYTS